MKSFFYRLSISENEKEENRESQILCVFELEDPSYAVHFTTFHWATSNMKLRLTRISILRSLANLQKFGSGFKCQVSMYVALDVMSARITFTLVNKGEFVSENFGAHTLTVSSSRIWRFESSVPAYNHTPVKQYADYACAVCKVKAHV